MTSEHEQLTWAARLLGRLLVRELDGATLDELSAPEVAPLVESIGIPLPAASELDELAHQWLAAFLHPQGGSPPVHSLYRDGGYQGDPAAAVRRIGEAAGLEIAPGARNAPVDHIGCILLLWSETALDRPELADILVQEHLDWATHALSPTAGGAADSFYPCVARTTLAFIRQLLDRQESQSTADPASGGPST